MVIPSVDSSSSSWVKHKPGQASSAVKPQAANKPLELDSTDKENHLRIEEKKQSPEQEPGLKSLADETFSASSSLDELNIDADLGSPDFTLELTSPKIQEPQLPAQQQKTATATKDPDERPNLPYTFNFGIRRPLSVAVAMSKPLLGNEAPANFSQAIQQTLDLAATNRLPYQQGSQISLVA